MVESSQEKQVHSATTPFTKEQLEQLYKLPQSPQFTVNSSCSLAQSGNYLVALSYVKPNDSWIIDSGAHDRMLKVIFIP